MNKYLLPYIAIVIGALSLQANVVEAQDFTNNILIVEIQTGGLNSAADEFIEIHNTSHEPILLEGWTVEYKSRNGTNWQSKASLTGYIPAGGRYLIATDGFDAQATLRSGLAAIGGHTRIVDSSGVEVDVVIWGEVTGFEGTATSLEAGQSLKRRVDEDGFFLRGLRDDIHFLVSTNPTPTGALWISSPSIPDEPNDINESVPVPERDYEGSLLEEELGVPELDIAYSSILVSEVMPDPIKPLTDADDEFVEVFNPHPYAVDLEGYVVETGKDYKSRYTLSGILVANSYKAFYSADGSMSLTNSGGSVRLRDPASELLSEIAYPKAEAGKSWSDLPSGWVWSIPSPGAENRVVEDGLLGIVGLESSPPNSAQQTNTLDTDQTATIELASVDESFIVGSDNGDAEQQEGTMSWLTLAGVGGLGVLYAVYEQRDRVRNYLKYSRRDRGDRSKDRSVSSWWRNNRFIERCRGWKDGIRSWLSQRIWQH